MMGSKVYSVKYYMDYETYGVHAIFQNKEDAVRHAEIMTEKNIDIDCHFTVCEEVVYSSLDELKEVAE